ncbi:hypothetical protein B0T24DRAFT_106040 [Lasiosphaeria ovina]|uniref:Secreted protein n=1 Tax=Lasiosphaeria ovina TaxID=92902 RepID=A0AAE0JV69_9PEZI|nr:hypothetical protein B0T24DRAFT_106040 [Lasiosphaeria ovina]
MLLLCCAASSSLVLVFYLCFLPLHASFVPGKATHHVTSQLGSFDIRAIFGTRWNVRCGRSAGGVCEHPIKGSIICGAGGKKPEGGREGWNGGARRKEGRGKKTCTLFLLFLGFRMNHPPSYRCKAVSLCRSACLFGFFDTSQNEGMYGEDKTRDPPSVVGPGSQQRTTAWIVWTYMCGLQDTCTIHTYIGKPLCFFSTCSSRGMNVAAIGWNF